jgi:hypothetical protein
MTAEPAIADIMLPLVAEPSAEPVAGMSGFGPLYSPPA